MGLFDGAELRKMFPSPLPTRLDDWSAALGGWADALEGGRYRVVRNLPDYQVRTDDLWIPIAVLWDLHDPSGWGDRDGGRRGAKWRHVVQTLPAAPPLLTTGGRHSVVHDALFVDDYEIPDLVALLRSGVVRIHPRNEVASRGGGVGSTPPDLPGQDLAEPASQITGGRAALA